MKAQIATRVVVTGDAALSTLVERGPCVLFHLCISPKTVNTAGVIQLYDGRGTDGRLVRQIETGYSRDCAIPRGVPCPNGLFVYNDANIGVWSVDYEPIGQAPFKE